MRATRLALLTPAVLFAATAFYVAANPTDQSVGQEQPPTGASETAAETPVEKSTSTPATDATQDALPPGLTGQLTYRSEGELITLTFPDATVVGREESVPGDLRSASADGAWRLQQQCSDVSCTLNFENTAGPVSEIDVAVLGTAVWSPDGHTLVFDGSIESGDLVRRLYAIDDPAAVVPRLLDQGPVTSFAWLGDGDLIVATEGGTELRRVSLTSGESSLALVSPIVYLHPSPDGHTVAFTQNGGGVDDQGWHLWTIDADGGTLRDLGNMGSDPAGVLPPVEVAPEQKGPMYIGWSPDGTKLAFGGGFEPPFIMTTVDIATGGVVRTEFPYGYPGEIKWSPDGTRIAVSTYDVGRTRHESYVVDPTTGVSTHVTSGCVIVWSYDGRFLAVHGEPAPGISIIDVETGAQGKLTHSKNDTPLTWEP